jgi:hypothetical protein
MKDILFFDSKECEWADMLIIFAGLPLTKIRGIEYKALKDKSSLHSAGDEPIGIQNGIRTYEGSIKVLNGALDDMNRASVAAGGADILDMQFDIEITYKQSGTRHLQTDILKGVEIKYYERGWDQVAKSMDVTMPIIFMRLKSQ